MSEELKPCPFCGGRASYENDNGRWTVGCDDSESDGIEVLCMGFQSLTVFARRSEAATAWNTRADLPATDAQALSNPKVQALVEAAEKTLNPEGSSPVYRQLIKQKLRAALAALKADE